ncbi:peptidase S28 [Kipferlia bialata]|uniref:Peptidase S28 n=1 Tax=Kipferlia bialata TaxID=797122 RepID=A0A9K3GK80_9EUKA|nr:peptidase S28 [Kipferlia bialata]|eukprot:g6948.t1
MLEHRFYGESHPFGDLSRESLRYLNSRQALEDVAQFIDFYDELIHPDTHVSGVPRNQWVVIGGSYGGALSAWFRIKYPHLAAASVASSGVVNCILDFTGFDQQVALAMGTKCANAVRTAVHYMERSLNSESERKALLKNLSLSLSAPLLKALLKQFGADSGMDDGDFMYMIADAGVMAMQYGHYEECCDVMDAAWDEGSDLVDAYAQWLNNWWVPAMNPDGPSGYDRRVLGQVAYYQNAPKVGSLRSSKYVNMEYHHNMCASLFGDDFLTLFDTVTDFLSLSLYALLTLDFLTLFDTVTDFLSLPLYTLLTLDFLTLFDTVADFPVDGTNEHYGAVNTHGSKIVYTNYWQDPWHLASIPQSLSEDQPLLLAGNAAADGQGPDKNGCFNCGHCRDMHAPQDDDPAELTQLRQTVLSYIAEWLA